MFEANDIPLYHSHDRAGAAGAAQIVHHEKLGNLSDHHAFVMRGRDRDNFNYTEISPLYIHLSITGRCQARCQGCINIAFNDLADQESIRGTALFKDTDPVRDALCIVKLIRENDNDTATVCLYGGEPLLAPDKMQALMENIARARPPGTVRYMLYTNGDLLEKRCRTHPEMMRAIWLYSVSIDGTREQHERIRRGTDLARIHAGLEAIRNIRQGRVLMWSTLREDQSLLDCFNEFSQLYEKGLVDQFFWHWVESSTPFVALSQYAAAYEKELRHIMDIYLAELNRGSLLPITHINELILYLLTGNRRKSTACGVELARNYDIADGRIHSCADLPGQYAIGTITPDGTPDLTRPDLSWLTLYKNDLGCIKCGVHAYCGGRCPVQAITGSFERLRQYCQLMRLHVSIVNDYLDDITSALTLHDITPQQIYDHSAFYVQFTDGTP